MRGRKHVLGFSGAGLLALLAPDHARAFEYPLQFTPVGNYKDLVVAGYQILGATIVGNCSYTQITSGSGRDPRTYYTPIPQTCTWDLYGNLSVVAGGAPAVPVPIATSGTQTIYARTSAKLYTGTDTAIATGGFVFKYGSHYYWTTSNAYTVLNTQAPYTFTATLKADGDTALIVSTVKATALLGKMTIDSTSCAGIIAVGTTCDVTVTYDDTKLSSATGLAYDTLTIHLRSNSGQAYDFVQRFTDVVRIPPDGGGG